MVALCLALFSIILLFLKKNLGLETLDKLGREKKVRACRDATCITQHKADPSQHQDRSLRGQLSQSAESPARTIKNNNIKIDVRH